jgi:hypothetical protein
MAAQMLRQGAGSLPVSLRLGRKLLRNQGISGTAGFAAGFRRPGRRQKRCVAAFLDAAVAGNEMAARRALRRGGAVSVGEENPIAVGEFVDRLRDGRWFKMIAAGDTVSASVDTPAGRGVVFCQIPGPAEKITRVDYFGAF